MSVQKQPLIGLRFFPCRCVTMDTKMILDHKQTQSETVDLEQKIKLLGILGAAT